MDTVEILIFMPIALMMVALAFVILKGWGDRLIAGYNTASEEERQQINIKRLRLLVAITCLSSTVLCLCMPVIGENIVAELTATGIFLLIILVIVILANTWAKTK